MSRTTLRIYLDADGKPVVRAFDEVATASTRSTEVVEENSRKQVAANDLVRDSSEKLHGVMSTFAATVGIGGLAFGISDVVKAGEKWQLQQAQLANALRNTGEYSKKTMDDVVESSEKLSTRGGFAGPEEIQSISQFIRLTGSASQAIKLNADATELARGTNIGYSQAQRMIGQVLTGNTGRLQRYLGIIQPVKTAEFELTQAHGFNLAAMTAQSKALGKLGPQWLAQQEILHNLTPAQVQHAQLLDRQATATIALQRIQERYGNSTQIYSRSTQGFISNLSNRFDLLGETIGRKALPIVTSIVGFMAGHTTALFAFAAALTGIALAYGTVRAAMAVGRVIMDGYTIAASGVSAVMTALTPLMASYAIAVESATVAGEEMTVATKALTFAQIALTAIMDVNPFILILTGAAALIGVFFALGGHLKTLENIFMSVFNFIKGIVVSVVDFIGNHWKMFAVGGAFFLGGPFLALPVWVATHFNEVKRFVVGFVRDVGHIFSSIWKVIVWPFEKAYDLIKKVIGFISGHTTKAQSYALAHSYDTYSTARFGFIPAQHRKNGGIIHASSGGLLDGWGGGDVVPAMLEPGEGILRKEAVASLGTSGFNAINSMGGASMPNGGPEQIPLTIVVPVHVSPRVIAETTTQFSLKKSALSGSYVTG